MRGLIFYTQKAAQSSAKEKTKMIYYRVKPEKDNVPKRKKGSFAQDGIYIGKETYWFFGARFQNKEG